MDNKFATCRLCNKKLKYLISTGNLETHVVKQQPIQYDQQLNKNKPVDATQVDTDDENESNDPSQVETISSTPVSPVPEAATEVEISYRSESQQSIFSGNLPGPSTSKESQSQHSQPLENLPILSTSKQSQQKRSICEPKYENEDDN
ncbi:unnamed protein product [Acanthoscelides obtectus]|uniref:BED-type domain-containing protein n=1 Tax=Acanthoscelides obtectus TaxID=200917 RepID=A0A9P0JR20_ACAOB|nr:unnamed protein product [Acanthoscelides obtectus]CAK1678877.1 hypothetical protein AOBTE_LOCUS32054 [Acanthoscelides obtectus]